MTKWVPTGSSFQLSEESYDLSKTDGIDATRNKEAEEQKELNRQISKRVTNRTRKLDTVKASSESQTEEEK